MAGTPIGDVEGMEGKEYARRTSILVRRGGGDDDDDERAIWDDSDGQVASSAAITDNAAPAHRPTHIFTFSDDADLDFSTTSTPAYSSL